MSDTAKAHNFKRRGSDPWMAEMNTHVYRIGWDREHKESAKHKIWSLTLDQYKKLATSPCHYCGRDPATKPTTRILQSMGVFRNGLDRVDNKKGYFLDNVVPCCESCNREKGKQKYCDFVENTVRRYRHMESIGLDKYGVMNPIELHGQTHKSAQNHRDRLGWKPLDDDQRADQLNANLDDILGP
jgi:hypothetical protein